MSGTSHAHAAGHEHNEFIHASEHGPVDLPHASLGGYLTGFFLSIVLTVVPFWLVMGDVELSKVSIIALILAFGIAQIVVHVVYFLHMNSKSEAGWNLMALIFTAILVFIVIVGSMWVMFHMNHNMMSTMHAGAVEQAQPAQQMTHEGHAVAAPAAAAAAQPMGNMPMPATTEPTAEHAGHASQAPAAHGAHSHAE